MIRRKGEGKESKGTTKENRGKRIRELQEGRGKVMLNTRRTRGRQDEQVEDKENRATTGRTR